MRWGCAKPNPKVNNARNNGLEMLERIDQMTQSGTFPR
jgi:hypothetical protein